MSKTYTRQAPLSEGRFIPASRLGWIAQPIPRRTSAQMLHRVARGGIGRANVRPIAGFWAGLLSLVILGYAGPSAYAQNLFIIPTIQTIAGTGTQGNGADGILATQSQINSAQESVVDSAGNVYFDDFNSCRVRRVDVVTGIVTTVAGISGSCGYNGDGILARNAQINAPEGLTIDAAGNLYIGDKSNERIRIVYASTGIIQTVAGNGTASFSGDGGAATSASLNNPAGVAIDAAGNIYIADSANSRIRFVSKSTGFISTIAGNGTAGYNGDGVAATSAELNNPYGVRVDLNNNIYILDGSNNRVRKVSASTGLISTIAGNGTAGYTGDGGTATSAELNTSGGSALAVDSVGNVYIGDRLNNVVREVTVSNGYITTVAGTGVAGYTGDNGPATSAELNQPQKISFDKKNGTYLVSDFTGSTIRSLNFNPPAFPSTPVGNTSAALNFYLKTTAAIKISSAVIPTSQGGQQEFAVGSITGCTVDGATINASGTVCKIPITFAPAYPGVRLAPLKVVTSTGAVDYLISGFGTAPQVVVSPGLTSTIAGTGVAGSSGDGSAASSAQLNAPGQSFVDTLGNIYIADTANNRVRKIAASSGNITTVAGSATICANPALACGDGGQATSASLNAPSGVAVDGSQQLFIADRGDNRIRVVNQVTGVISAFAGTGAASYSGDNGLAASATLNAPSGVFVDASDNVFIADSGNNVIREVGTITNVIVTVAGNNNACSSSTAACGDGGAGTQAQFNTPVAVVADANDNLYIADRGDNRIRKLTAASNVVSTVAGTGNSGYSGDGAAATSALLNAPVDISIDSAGDLYIVGANNVVRFVASGTGTISTIAGSATACPASTATCGDGGPSNSANFYTPGGVVLDSPGNLYITDTGDNRVRRISASSLSLAYTSTPIYSTSTNSPQTVTFLSTGTSSLTIPPPATGTNASIANGFSIANSSTCPQLTTASSAVTLASGSSCNYVVSFVPNAVGNLSGTLTLSDNAANASSPYAMQSVNLSGTGTHGQPYSNTLTTSNGTPNFGQSVMFTDTVTSQGSIVPTGTITFSNGNSVLGMTSLNGSGVATLSSSNLPVGGNTVTAVYSGDGDYLTSTANSVSETVAKASAGSYSNVLTSSNTTPVYGQNVNLAASVGSVGGVAPTGSVTFYAGNVAIGSGALSGGNISLPTSALPAGSSNLTAVYAGDANYATSTSNTVVETVAKVSATSNDTVSGSNSYGSATTPVTASIPFSGSAPSTGSVTIADTNGNTVTIAASSCTAAGAVLSCQANFPTANEPLGSNSLTVAQASDTNYNGSSGTGTLTISQATSGPLAGPGSAVQSVSIPQGTATATLTVTIPYTAPAAPTGAVSVTVAGATAVTASCSSGASPQICTAAYPTTALGIGTYAIVASQAMDAHYPAATASATLTVGTGVVSPMLNSGSKVQDVTIVQGTTSATLTALLLYSGTAPTGAVTFDLPGGAAVMATCTSGTSPLTCTAIYPTASLPSATYTITATEAADAAYPQGSSTAKLTITASLSVVVSPVLNNGSSMDNVLVPYGTTDTTFKSTLAYTSNAPTGTVGFTVTGGSGSVNASCSTGASPLTCTASYPTASLAVGSYAVAATEAGDSNYPAGTALGTLTVTLAAATSADTVSGSGSYGSSSAAITATIPYSGTVPPAGSITVSDTHGNTVAIAAASCTTTGNTLTCTGAFPTANLPVGADALTIAQAADSNYTGSSGTGTLTLARAAATTTDTVSGSGIYGSSSAAIIATIPYSGTVAPSGSITVSDTHGNTVAIIAASCTAAGSTLNCTGTTFPIANLPVGTDVLTIGQAADSNYTGSSGTGTLTLARATATTTDMVSGTGTYGSPSAAITTNIPYSGTVAPSGTISVSDTHGNTVALAAASCTAASNTLTCTGTFPTANLPVGADALTIAQAADSNYSGSGGTGSLLLARSSVSAPALVQNVTVTQGTATTTLSASIPFSGVAAPSGAVSFSVGGGSSVPTTCTGTTSLICIATYPVSSLAVGTYPISTIQAADINYAANFGSATLTVGTGIVSPILNSSSNVQNEAVSQGSSTAPLQAEIVYSGPAPTGAVTFNVNGTTAQAVCTSGTSPLLCTASYSGPMAAGSYPIVATEAADANYPQGTSDATLTVTPTTSTVLAPLRNAGSSVSNQLVPFGNPVTALTANIAFSGPAPTGGVSFMVVDGTGSSVAATCAGEASSLTCTASYPTATLAQGSYTIMATQAADASYPQGTAIGTLTVTQALVLTGFTASGSATYGALGALLTVTIPYAGTIAPTGIITVTDAHGNTQTLPASGCTSAAAVFTCNATFSAANLLAGSDPLAVTQAPDPNYPANAGAGTLTITKVAPTTADQVTSNGIYGSATTPLIVAIPYAGGQPSTGTITVFFGSGLTLSVPSANCTAANGLLTCTANLPTQNLPVGATPLTVVQAPDSNYSGSTGTGSITISSNASGTLATVSGTANYGSPAAPIIVTITYAGFQPPAGPITVSDANHNTLAVPANSCVAVSGVLTCATNFPITNLLAGRDPLTVSQAADVNYPVATGTGAVIVNKAPGSPRASVMGTTSFGAQSGPVTVQIPYAGTALPTGSITVSDNHGNTLTVSASNCAGTAGVLTCTGNFPTANLLAATDSMTISQAEDANYLGATGTGLLTVNKGSSIGMLAASSLALIQGQSTTFIDTLSTLGAAVPTGSVSFYTGSTLAGTVALNSAGVATLPVSTLPAAVDSITAIYSGDANYSSSTSNVVQVTVTALLSTSIALTSSANPQIAGQPFTITATIGPAGAAATGTVSFYSGTQALGTAAVNSSGVASLVTSALPAGMLSITASYGGDSLHLASVSPVLAQVVTDFTIGSSTSIVSINPGQLATFTFNINPVGGTTFGDGVTLTATGSPSGSQTFFGPVSVIPGNAGVTANMTVVTFNSVAARAKPSPSGTLSAVLTILLFPLVALRRLRRKLSSVILLVLITLGSLGMLTLTSCAAGGSSGQAPSVYTITVTGTSGLLQHSTTVTLILAAPQGH